MKCLNNNSRSGGQHSSSSSTAQNNVTGVSLVNLNNYSFNCVKQNICTMISHLGKQNRQTTSKCIFIKKLYLGSWISTSLTRNQSSSSRGSMPLGLKIDPSHSRIPMHFAPARCRYRIVCRPTLPKPWNQITQHNHLHSAISVVHFASVDGVKL